MLMIINNSDHENEHYDNGNSNNYNDSDSIALKGTIQLMEKNLLIELQTVSNMHTHVTSVQLCANHEQSIRCFSCATCHFPHGAKGQLSY